MDFHEILYFNENLFRKSRFSYSRSKMLGGGGYFEDGSYFCRRHSRTKVIDHCRMFDIRVLLCHMKTEAETASETPCLKVT